MLGRWEVWNCFWNSFSSAFRSYARCIMMKFCLAALLISFTGCPRNTCVCLSAWWQCIPCKKAQKYADKAGMQLEKLNMLFYLAILPSYGTIYQLDAGHKATALQEISQVRQLCQQLPWLLSNHAAQLHALLGQYSFSINCMDNAEAQFTTALRTHQEPLHSLWQT